MEEIDRDFLESFMDSVLPGWRIGEVSDEETFTIFDIDETFVRTVGRDAFLLNKNFSRRTDRFLLNLEFFRLYASGEIDSVSEKKIAQLEANNNRFNLNFSYTGLKKWNVNFLEIYTNRKNIRSYILCSILSNMKRQGLQFDERLDFFQKWEKFISYESSFVFFNVDDFFYKNFSKSDFFTRSEILYSDVADMEDRSIDDEEELEKEDSIIMMISLFRWSVKRPSNKASVFISEVGASKTSSGK
jgi:hypothetical protein